LFITEAIIRRPAGALGYPFTLPALRRLQSLAFRKRVTFLAGENGTGKSTLLEAIAVRAGFNAEGGTRNFNFTTASTHSELHRAVKLVWGIYRPSNSFFLRAESFYNVASEIDRMDGEPSPLPRLIDSYGGISLHEQSHGESFMALVMNRFSGNGLYILDEPEAALSPSRQMALLARIHDLAEENCQFIIATHSPILLAYPGADIYVLTEEGAALTPYRETEHYIVTKQFLNNPEGMLRHLLNDK
jgi:predicted ATPase